VPGNAME